MPIARGQSTYRRRLRHQ